MSSLIISSALSDYIEANLTDPDRGIAIAGVKDKDQTYGILGFTIDLNGDYIYDFLTVLFFSYLM